MYELEHITKENGKWFACVVVKDNGAVKREHTGDLWGWNGMTYNALKCMLLEYYNISLPKVSELKLIKKTTARCIYTIKEVTV